MGGQGPRCCCLRTCSTANRKPVSRHSPGNSSQSHDSWRAVIGTASWNPNRQHSEIRRRVFKKWHFVGCICDKTQSIREVKLCGLRSVMGYSEIYLTGNMREVLISPSVWIRHVTCSWLRRLMWTEETWQTSNSPVDISSCSRIELFLKIRDVPRSKHSAPRLKEPIS